MGYDDDYYQSHQILFGLIFLVLFIHQKFHHIEMFFYGIKMRFLMRVHQILEFFNRPSVKLALILIVVAVFLLVIWIVLSWIEEKLNQYEEKSRTKKKSRRNLKKSNPIFPGIHRRPGVFQRIFKKYGKTDESFFQSKGFEENNNNNEEEKDMDILTNISSQEDPESFDESSEMSHDIQYPSMLKTSVIENKTKEMTKNQRNQTKKKVKQSSFFEDKDILGLR